MKATPFDTFLTTFSISLCVSCPERHEPWQSLLWRDLADFRAGIQLYSAVHASLNPLRYCTCLYQALLGNRLYFPPLSIFLHSLNLT
jgi:hypothetical protein